MSAIISKAQRKRAGFEKDLLINAIRKSQRIPPNRQGI
jgi:hypothetical protein